MPDDVAEDQLPLPARVAGIYDAGHVLAAKQLDEELEALLRALDGPQVEVRWDHRQVGEGPFASLHLDAFGRDELEQMADRRGKHVIAAFVVVAVTRETPQG